MQDALLGLAARVRADAAIITGAAGSKQKRLSMLIDAKNVADIRRTQGGNRLYLQHLALQTIHGAGAGITALPTDGDLRLDPPSFRITVARRLRLAIQPEDSECPRCGALWTGLETMPSPAPARATALGATTPCVTTSMTRPRREGWGPRRRRLGSSPPP